MQGLAQGYIGLLYDKGYVVNETTDLTQAMIPTLTLQRDDGFSSAVGSLDKCIEVCPHGNNFTITRHMDSGNVLYTGRGNKPDC